MKHSFFHLLLSVFVFGSPYSVATGNHAEIGNIRREQKDRPINKNWNPHAMVASILERASATPDAWGQPKLDSFDVQIKSIRSRLHNLGSEPNEAELAALGSETARLENAQKVILRVFESIREDTKSTASEEQKENLEKVIRLFQIRLEEARNAKELVTSFSKATKTSTSSKGEQK